MQGGFGRRRFSQAERLALRFGRFVPGTASRLPLRQTILNYNSGCSFPWKSATVGTTIWSKTA